MKNLIIISALFALFMQGCTEEDIILTNQGNITEYQLNVEDYENVSLLGPVNLRITQGNEISTSVETTPGIFNELVWEVKDQTLEIGFDRNISHIDPDVAVWVNVTLPGIKKIAGSGLNNIVSEGDLDLPSLGLHVSGNANIALTGKVNEQTISVSGMADINNFGLSSLNTSISISGIGDVEVSCTESLDVEVSGSAWIAYKGNPVI
ncbi:MAG: DUF2807 domain-containing protein, partial [Cyclobacteriaceae bacterium]|nr:DUF2807 domain-containing protein [Cyclobacteriaceae bacterium]